LCTKNKFRYSINLTLSDIINLKIKSRMRWKMKKKFLVIVAVLSAILVSAWSVPDYYNYVNDFINVIAPAEEAELNSLLQKVEQEKGVQIAIVTVNVSQDIRPKEMATEIFNKWGVGSKGKDNGVVFLLALDPDGTKGGNEIQIEVGYGLEGILPDAKVGRIIDDYMISDLSGKEYGKAFISGVKALSSVIYQDPSMAPENKSNSFMDEIGPEIIVFFVIALIVIVFGSAAGSFYTRPKCPKCGTRMKLENEQIVERATYSHAGSGIRYFYCPKCGNRGSKSYNIPKKTYVPPVIISGGGRKGGGFGGGFGGFGGGSSGGGGAGRKF
jgi:uncharacterized protein